MKIINIITPVGDLYNLDQTINSVKNVSKLNYYFKFKHILIFNNKTFKKFSFQNEKNYQICFYDINPISSRAKARNYGISKIDFKMKSLVIFLDVGDILLSEPFNFIEKKYSNQNITKIIFKNKTLCKINNKTTNVPYYPIFMKAIVNPFMLSCVFASSDLIEGHKFVDEKKEDWIFWYNILLQKPNIIKTDLPSYIYSIDNIKGHYKKKYNSFLRLILILQKFFLWKKPFVYFVVILHLFFIIIRWFLIRINLLR